MLYDDNKKWIKKTEELLDKLLDLDKDLMEAIYRPLINKVGRNVLDNKIGFISNDTNCLETDMTTYKKVVYTNIHRFLMTDNEDGFYCREPMPTLSYLTNDSLSTTARETVVEEYRVLKEHKCKIPYEVYTACLNTIVFEKQEHSPVIKFLQDGLYTWAIENEIPLTNTTLRVLSRCRGRKEEAHEWMANVYNKIRPNANGVSKLAIDKRLNRPGYFKKDDVREVYAPFEEAYLIFFLPLGDNSRELYELTDNEAILRYIWENRIFLTKEYPVAEYYGYK